MLMLLLWLSLFLCCLPGAKACLQCDRKVRRLHEDLSLSAPTPKLSKEIKEIYGHAHSTYKVISREREGVIDRSTLYRARTEYENEFNRFLEDNRIGTASWTLEIIQIMEKGRKILQKHLDSCQLCPNTCGLLRRRVIDCVTCEAKIHTCVSPSGDVDCDERSVKAEEGDQAVLDCFRSWHLLLLGKPRYHYFWAPGQPGDKMLKESDFRALVVTDDSHVVLNQLQANEQGTYRCSLKAKDGNTFYRTTFLLTVTPVLNDTDQRVATLLTLPTLPDRISSNLSEDLLVYVIAMVTVVSVVASICLTVVLGIMIHRRRNCE